MQPFDADRVLGFFMVIAMALILLFCNGCEPGGDEHYSDAEIRRIVAEEQGSGHGDVTLGQNVQAGQIDTVDGNVKVGDGSTVGDINTAAAPAEG